ncbi:MAG TPA: hypothetical protein VGU19_03285 [Microvirga sp.]|jgi:hypothetical protein|nr:hypothetical protein [Microvirga sp.]
MDDHPEIPDYSDADVSDQEGARELYAEFRASGEALLATAAGNPGEVHGQIDAARENLRAAEQIRHAYESFYKEPIADDVELLATPEYTPGSGPAGSFETEDEILRRLNTLIRERYPHLSPYVRGEDRG